MLGDLEIGDDALVLPSLLGEDDGDVRLEEEDDRLSFDPFVSETFVRHCWCRMFDLEHKCVENNRKELPRILIEATGWEKSERNREGTRTNIDRSVASRSASTDCWWVREMNNSKEERMKGH